MPYSQDAFDRIGPTDGRLARDEGAQCSEVDTGILGREFQKMDLDRLNGLLDRIGFTDWLIVAGLMGDGFFLQCQWADHGELQKGRKWYISTHATPSEVVQTALLAVLTAAEHEIRERFTFDGEAIFSPHFDVDALYEVAMGKRFQRRVG